MEGTDNNSIANESHLNQNYPIRSNVGISTFEIAQEDLEEGPLRMDCTATGVDDTEVIHFIEKSVLSEGYYDYYDQVLPTIFEHPNMSKATVPCPRLMLVFYCRNKYSLGGKLCHWDVPSCKKKGICH
jgi:hypothetical protein